MAFVEAVYDFGDCPILAIEDATEGDVPREDEVPAHEPTEAQKAVKFTHL